MKQDLRDKRMDYSQNAIDFSQTPREPMELFESWFQEALKSELIQEAYAMSLSTLDADGFPRNRVVLLKEFSSDGFVFYTNYESHKGKAISAHPKVCLSFFWDKLERQVIIRGVAEKNSFEDSNSYFHRRPVESQIGALVSQQSSVIALNEDLDAEKQRLLEKFEGKEIPKPDYWGGFLVRPVEIEFWQGRPSRLHDRLSYKKTEGEWVKERLAP